MAPFLPPFSRRVSPWRHHPRRGRLSSAGSERCRQRGGEQYQLPDRRVPRRGRRPALGPAEDAEFEPGVPDRPPRRGRRRGRHRGPAAGAARSPRPEAPRSSSPGTAPGTDATATITAPASKLYVTSTTDRKALAQNFLGFRQALVKLQTGGSSCLLPGGAELLSERLAQAMPLPLDEVPLYRYGYDPGRQRGRAPSRHAGPAGQLGPFDENTYRLPHPSVRVHRHRHGDDRRLFGAPRHRSDQAARPVAQPVPLAVRAPGGDLERLVEAGQVGPLRRQRPRPGERRRRRALPRPGLLPVEQQGTADRPADGRPGREPGAGLGTDAGGPGEPDRAPERRRHLGGLRDERGVHRPLRPRGAGAGDSR